MYRFSCVVILFIAALVCQAQKPAGDALRLYHASRDKKISFREALAIALYSLNVAKQEVSDSVRGLCHLNLGILYWNDGAMTKATNHLDTAQILFEKACDIRRVAQCIHYRGLVRYYLSQYDSALYFYGVAEEHYLTLNNDSAVAKLKSHKGLIYGVRGQYDLAIQTLMSSFRLQESLPGYRDITLPVDLPTTVSSRLYYESKLEKDLGALAFLTQSPDSTKLAFILFNLAKDYHYLSDYEKAIAYHRRSIFVSRKIRHSPFYQDLASSFAHAQMYDSARKYYEIALTEVQEKGTRIHLAALNTEIGRFYKMQEKWKEALHFYLASRALYQELQFPRAISHACSQLADIHSELNEHSTALSYISRSLELATIFNCKRDRQEFLMKKAGVLEMLGLHTESLELIKESMGLLKEITSGENQLTVAHLNLKYETEKKNRDLNHLTIENHNKEVEIENKKLLMSLGLATAVLSIALALVVHRKSVQGEATSRALSLKNEIIENQNTTLKTQAVQKEALLHEIHHRVKNNLQIILSLINLKLEDAPPKENEILQQLNARIFSMGLIHEKLYQNKDVQWIRIDAYLSEICRFLINSFTTSERPVDLEFDCADLVLDSGDALSCGLICNELITNALKHAFTPLQEVRRVRVQLEAKDKEIAWVISDNGKKGISAPSGFNNSFGLRFVNQLVTSKLGGHLELKFGTGVTVIITFPYQRHA